MLDHKQNMKYLLFNLVVLILFIAAARNLLGGGSSVILAPEYHVADLYTNQTCIPSQQHPQHHDGMVEINDPKIRLESPVSRIRRIVNARFSLEEKSEPTRTTAPDPPSIDGSCNFPLEGMVELYDDKSYFATPAIVTGYKNHKSSTSYNLKNAITNARHSGVAPEFINPYQVYGDGTHASCNVGALRMHMVPCKIVSHSIKKSGFVWYEVSYLNKEVNVWVQEYLPFSRVQRIRTERVR